MKKTHLLYIVCLLLSGSLLLNGLAQDFAAQWHLHHQVGLDMFPEHARGESDHD